MNRPFRLQEEEGEGRECRVEGGGRGTPWLLLLMGRQRELQGSVGAYESLSHTRGVAREGAGGAAAWPTPLPWRSSGEMRRRARWTACPASPIAKQNAERCAEGGGRSSCGAFATRGGAFYWTRRLWQAATQSTRLHRGFRFLPAKGPWAESGGRSGSPRGPGRTAKGKAPPPKAKPGIL